MMGKYDIDGQLKMLLCWRKSIKSVAADMSLNTSTAMVFTKFYYNISVSVLENYLKRFKP